MVKAAMDDPKYLTIYDVMFPSSELKPDKKLRNYSDEAIVGRLENAVAIEKEVDIPGRDRVVLKKIKAHKKFG